MHSHEGSCGAGLRVDCTEAAGPEHPWLMSGMYWSREWEGRVLGGGRGVGLRQEESVRTPELLLKRMPRPQWREYTRDELHYAGLCAAGGLSAAPKLFR